MKLELQSIARRSGRFYNVVLVEAGGTKRAFVFEVEDGPIEVLKWGSEAMAAARVTRGLGWNP